MAKYTFTWDYIFNECLGYGFISADAQAVACAFQNESLLKRDGQSWSEFWYNLADFIIG